MPTTPQERGWFELSKSFPLREVAIGMLSFSANVSNSFEHPECLAPPPATIIGLEAV